MGSRCYRCSRMFTPHRCRSFILSAPFFIYITNSIIYILLFESYSLIYILLYLYILIFLVYLYMSRFMPDWCGQGRCFDGDVADARAYAHGDADAHAYIYA